MQHETAQRYHRQLDIIDPERLASQSITIIGTGAIGSFTSLLLAKMGAHTLQLFDPDTVELHNLPNQMFPAASIGKPKADETKRLIEVFEGVEVDAHPVAYVDQDVEGIVILAVDSIEARRQVFRQVRFSPKVDLLIDGRMGAEVAQLYALDPKAPSQVRAYADSLHAPEEVFEAPCTAKATLYCAGAIASVICGTVVRFVMGEDFKRSLIFDLKQMILIDQ